MSEYQESSDIKRRREVARWKAGLDGQDLAKNKNPLYSFQGDCEDHHLAVKHAAAQDLRECRWSREEVAEGLTRLLGQPISLAQIDAMVADTKSHRLPAAWVPAWCRVTGSRRVLELLVAECGLWLADDREHDLAELARAELAREQIGARIEEIRSRL